MVTEQIKLSNGVYIPKLGFGTYSIEDNDGLEILKKAITIGYRHFDTAQRYNNEDIVGKAIKQSGISRKDFFVTTKIDFEHKSYKHSSESIDSSLRSLQVDYLDLLLIHAPQPWKLNDGTLNDNKESNYYVWKSLEDAYQNGKVRSIGVSNFKIQDLEYLLKYVNVSPMVNQFLFNITTTPNELVSFCKENSIAVEAYSPLDSGNLISNNKYNNLLKKYDVSLAQLCLKYVLQHGAIAIPRTKNTQHMKENLNLDFSISDDDMKYIVQLNNKQFKTLGVALRWH